MLSQVQQREACGTVLVESVGPGRATVTGESASREADPDAFHFDTVWGSRASQADVFEQVSQRSSCVLALHLQPEVLGENQTMPSQNKRRVMDIYARPPKNTPQRENDCRERSSTACALKGSDP